MTRKDPRGTFPAKFLNSFSFPEMSLHSDKRLLQLTWPANMEHQDYWKRKEEERRMALKRKRMVDSQFNPRPDRPMEASPSEFGRFTEVYLDSTPPEAPGS